MALLALAGVSMRILGGLGVAGVVGVVLAYFFYRVATVRIDDFLFGTGDNFQVENALRTLTAGGLFGMGPGRRARANSACPSRTPTISSRSSARNSG